MIQSSVSDWDTNVETIVHWSPFSSEADLLRQFNLMKDHVTQIIIFGRMTKGYWNLIFMLIHMISNSEVLTAIRRIYK